MEPAGKKYILVSEWGYYIDNPAGDAAIWSHDPKQAKLFDKPIADELASRWAKGLVEVIERN